MTAFSMWIREQRPHYSRALAAEVAEIADSGQIEDEETLEKLIQTAVDAFTEEQLDTLLSCLPDLEPVFELIDKISSKATHFTEEDVLTLLTNLPDEESIYQLVNSTDAIFTENGLNELCDYGVNESLIRNISKRSGIPYADPDEPDEKFPLKEILSKKPGLFSSILMGMSLAGSHKPKSTGGCTGDCAHCPPHYGYRYGRWYYGHWHTLGCEFCGNRGCRGKCNID